MFWLWFQHGISISIGTVQYGTTYHGYLAAKLVSLLTLPMASCTLFRNRKISDDVWNLKTSQRRKINLFPWLLGNILMDRIAILKWEVQSAFKQKIMVRLAKMEWKYKVNWSTILSAISHKLHVSGSMLIWTFFLVLICGSRAQSFSASFSYILYIPRRWHLTFFQRLKGTQIMNYIFSDQNDKKSCCAQSTTLRRNAEIRVFTHFTYFYLDTR
jgi:hypothetical protein